MATKSISSPMAQNDFGQVLHDAIQIQKKYIEERNGVPQAVILSFDDFSHLLESETERKQMQDILREVRPQYVLGRVVVSKSNTK